MSLFTLVARAFSSALIVLNDPEPGAPSSSSDDRAEAVTAETIASQLNAQVLACYGAFLSDDGRAVDYAGMAQSPEFAAYAAATRQLRRVDAAALGPAERTAFFINLYNMLEIHARIHAQQQHAGASLKSVKPRCAYRVGAHVLTLDDIEHGVLRDNRRPPYNPARRFLPSDPQLALCVPLDNRVHFALVCGAKSCPPVRIFKPDNLERGLDAAAKAFCNDPANVQLDASSSTVRLSKIFSWYAGDFEDAVALASGDGDAAAIRFVVKHLRDGDLKRDLEGLLKAGSPSVAWLPYDWSANAKA